MFIPVYLLRNAPFTGAFSFLFHRKIDIFVQTLRLMKKFIFMFFALLLTGQIHAQTKHLQPGFDPEEYTEMLGIIARQIDTPWTQVKIPLDEKYRLALRSPRYFPDNRWDLWTSADSLLVIDLHATTGSFESWMENYYAAMIPATGTWKISDSLSFSYCLATDSRAAVHAGWMLALAYMTDDIGYALDSVMNLGYRNLIITGHSQGGALACLFTAWLRHRQLNGHFTKLNIKTYCSASPKPGNQYFAWDFTSLTQMGWAFNVINPLDWVPETPFTLQTTRDMNRQSPFSNIKNNIRKQKFPMNLVVRHLYNRMNKPLEKTSRRLNHFMGKKVHGQLAKNTAIHAPDYDGCMNYVAAGQQIILKPDSAYYAVFCNENTGTFTHHMLRPYYFLIKSW